MLLQNTVRGSAVIVSLRLSKLLTKRRRITQDETVENAIRDKEGERILKYVKEDSYVITLEIRGKMLTSEELSEKVDTLGVQGISHIIFIIGGSIGLGKEVLKRSDYALSFSKMTFPHQLMRVILLEQIYRSYRIINHEPYHK